MSPVGRIPGTGERCHQWVGYQGQESGVTSGYDTRDRRAVSPVGRIPGTGERCHQWVGYQGQDSGVTSG